MAAPPETRTLRIGEALKRGRARMGLDIAGAEERTKIRIRYLRALEEEDWETLPGPTYVKGFLRTYGGVLGLDAEALVDEYRREVESRLPGEEYPLSDTVLEHRRRLSDGSARRWPVLAAVLGAGAAALVIFLALGGDDEGHDRAGKGRAQHGAHQGRREKRPAESAGGPVALALTPKEAVEICLVRGDGQAQIDSQTLFGGSTTGPFQPPASRYRLDLATGGAIRLSLNGKETRVASRRAASFKITAAGVEETDYRGPACP